MTVKRKKIGGFSGGRTVTVAFSLCLLAVVTMIGMYTVGRTDQQQKELEQQVAEAEEEARAREQAQAEAEKAAKEAEKSEETEELADAEKTQEAASGSASRDKAGEAAADAAGETAGTEGTGMADGAELESEFAEIDPEGTGGRTAGAPANATNRFPHHAALRAPSAPTPRDEEEQSPAPSGNGTRRTPTPSAATPNDDASPPDNSTNRESSRTRAMAPASAPVFPNRSPPDPPLPFFSDKKSRERFSRSRLQNFSRSNEPAYIPA